MKRKIAVLIFAMIGLTGCATHFHRIEGDKLHLYLKKSKVLAVYFACSLDDFELHKARKIDTETWEVSLPANKEFRYFYIADKEIFLPVCRFAEMDDFGSKNCIFIPGM